MRKELEEELERNNKEEEELKETKNKQRIRRRTEGRNRKK